MKPLAGTSGYSFKEWKGTCYPEDIKADAVLGFYSSKFPTIEINKTFHRLPKEHVLLAWAAQVPDESLRPTGLAFLSRTPDGNVSNSAALP